MQIQDIDPSPTGLRGIAFRRHIVSALWRARFAIFAATITLPTLSAPLLGDDSHALYFDAATFRGSIRNAISFTIREMPDWASHGNFRPLGRLGGEHLPHMFAWKVAARFDITPPHAYSLTRFFALMALAWACSLLCRSLSQFASTYDTRSGGFTFHQRWELVTLATIAVFIAPYARTSSSLNFAPIYLTSTTLCLLAAVLIIRVGDRSEPRSADLPSEPEPTREAPGLDPTSVMHRVRSWLPLIALFCFGWAVSWWNELALASTLAVTLGIGYFAFRTDRGRMIRAAASCGIGLVVGMAWARVTIAAAPPTPGGRYDVTSLEVGWRSVPVFFNRVLSSSPVGVVVEVSRTNRALGILLGVGIVAAMGIAARWLFGRTSGARTSVSSLLLGFGLTLVFSSAAIPAISSQWINRNSLDLESWRETVNGRVGWVFVALARDGDSTSVPRVRRRHRRSDHRHWRFRHRTRSSGDTDQWTNDSRRRLAHARPEGPHR